MRQTRLSLGVLCAALVTVVVSALVDRAAELAAGWWQWAAAAVVTGAAGSTLTWQVGRDRTPPRTRLRLTDRHGGPPRLADVSAADLGVHPSTSADDSYIGRHADPAVLRAVVGDSVLVVVAGPRLAGSTRTLVEGAQSALPEAKLVSFVDDPAIEVRQLLADARALADPGERVVLWLDGISADRLRQFDASLTEEFAASVRVLATADARLVHRGVPNGELVRVDVLSDGERSLVAADEHRRAVLESAPVRRVALGALMVPLGPVAQALEVTDGPSADRVAILRAATDWSRVGAYGRLTEPLLETLYRAYRRELTGADRAGGFQGALEDSVLSAPHLLSERSQDGVAWYAPHPLLAVVADSESGWQVNERLWVHLVQSLDEHQRQDLGARCLAAGDAKHAAQLLDRLPVGTVAARDLLYLAVSLHRAGERVEGRRWYRRVLATGHPEYPPTAMVDLGVLARDEGHLDEARRWFGKAVATGHADQSPTAAVNLGVLESQQGHWRAARERYGEAIASAHPDQAPRAMVNLAVMERKAGRVEEARRWFTEAIAAEHPEHTPAAMAGRGILELEEGNWDEARHWLDKAISSGHPDHAPRAMVNLGFLERRVGSPDEARRRYSDAVATGHPRWAAVARGALAMPDARAHRDGA